MTLTRDKEGGSEVRTARPLGNLHGNWFSLHKLIPNARLYSSCVPAVRDFQPEWYWTAHRAHRGGGSQVSQLSVCFSLLLPFCIMDLLGTAQLCVWALSSQFHWVSRLSVSLSPRRSRFGAQELCEHGEVQLSSHILSLRSPPQSIIMLWFFLIFFCGHQTSLKNNAKDFKRGDLRNIVTWWSCDYLDQSEFCACTTRRRSFL